LRWGAGHDSAFSVVIDFGKKMPSGFTGEVPEFHFVAAVAVEKKVGEGVQWQWIHPDQSVSRNETLVIE